VEIAPLPVGRRVAALATRQHGVVAARQLIALGLAQQTIADWVAAGRLHRVHRGVYAVGHTVLPVRGHWTAAVLAGGPGAALSHASAAAFWDLRRTAAAIIDITVPGRAGRTKRPGLRVHRPRTLRPLEVTKHDGLRVTTPARTILDLAAAHHIRLERLLDQAEILELTDYPALDAIAQAHPGHPGAGRLRRLLAAYEAGATLKRSELERLFLMICEAAELPAPLVNHPLGDKEVDFLFAEHRLIVEIDSWRYHKTRRAFDADRARDALHLQSGYRTVRFTDRQLEHEPHTVASTLEALLSTS
jgi:hypothetical protein